MIVPGDRDSMYGLALRFIAATRETPTRQHPTFIIYKHTEMIQDLHKMALHVATPTEMAVSFHTQISRLT